MSMTDPSNPVVYLDVAIGDQPPGRMTFELYRDACPLTADNFRALCTGETGLGLSGKQRHYKGTVFHRIIPNFMLQVSPNSPAYLSPVRRAETLPRATGPAGSPSTGARSRTRRSRASAASTRDQGVSVPPTAAPIPIHRSSLSAPPTPRGSTASTSCLAK
jgi:hypothetical protein